MNTPNEFNRPEGLPEITTPQQRFMRIRELLKHLPPLPWKPGANSNVKDANGDMIIHTTHWTGQSGFTDKNDAVAEVLVHLSHLLAPPGHLNSTVMAPDDTLTRLQDDVFDTANQLFPDRKQPSAFLKLYGEVGEIIDNPSDPGEWADVFILLLDLARINNIDVEKAVRDKMAVLRRRQWFRDEMGVFQHKPRVYVMQPGQDGEAA